MTDAHAETVQSGNAMAAVSSAIVKLHQEQFGRGPTHARSHWAGRDAVVCVLENALLPAERAMVEMGEDQRVRESRTFLQAATARLFVEVVEDIVGRKVRGFASATDPGANIVFEVFTFDAEAGAPTDGHDGALV